MAQLETATVGAGLDMDSASADSASASPTRRSRWKTWKTWRERPQPCLMRDKRVWLTILVVIFFALWFLEASVSWLILCFVETLFIGRSTRHWRYLRLCFAFLALGTLLAALVLQSRGLANGDLRSDVIFSFIFFCIVMLQMLFAPCDRCQSWFVVHHGHRRRCKQPQKLLHEFQQSLVCMQFLWCFNGHPVVHLIPIPNYWMLHLCLQPRSKLE